MKKTGVKKLQKVIIFGLGSLFKEYEEDIRLRWEIIGVTDNNSMLHQNEDLYIAPDNLKEKKDVNIVICVKEAYLDIYRQLIEYGFCNEDIINITEVSYKKIISAWEKQGSILPPPDEYKRLVVQDYAKRNDCVQLIETGTYLGGMVEAQLNKFDNIASIELSNELFQKAVQKFKGIESVHLYCGDSGNLIGEVIEKENAFEKTLFWLDGHYSGGETACGEDESPIMKELGSISKKCRNGVILIDDARCFVGKGGYPTIEQLKSYMESIFIIKSWENETDIIRCVFDGI